MIAAFVADQCSLAEFCNFGALLEDMLRDRLVCGVNNSKIQWALLSEKTLTWAKALEVAQGTETAAKNDKSLSMGEAISSETVHRVAPRDGRKGKSSRFIGTCFCCGKVGYK